MSVPVGDRSPQPGRGRWLLLLTLLVVGAHLLLTHWAGSALRGMGEAQALERMEAAFITELRPTAPPAVPAAAAPAAPPKPAAVPARPASAASAAEPTPAVEPVPPEAASVPPLADTQAADAGASAPGLASSASAPASAPEAAATAVAAASAASAVGGGDLLEIASFRWPPSTRLSYTLTGWVRGEVHGSAQVGWLREGARYQVQLDVLVGPRVAPLVQRHMTSDGDITAAGLVPRQYEESTETVFGRPRRNRMNFGPEQLQLANGNWVAKLPGVQDTASQFVQLSWLLSSQPQRLLVAGGSVELPLALPRRQDPWVYEVVGMETLDTELGAIDTWHLRPRREGDPSTLSVEAWFAPSLQYLPVRIVIRQDEDNFVDLLIEKLPQQALAGVGPASSPAR
ncbi:DUF3108 domain-containing protein [Rivibacter subsaxonicus]|uniref:Uncharacterized protein DUF3108 n=1 Tax=Rivibacter subsaxonicus TaxID=457575 RepID=A0A4Q7VGQ3_9BURK|nr:DUF3108 domain-containing protein [Rivibacter subsaxonicus]RZT95221.1 uncharacterized protein DUF3108 [Rivibacter subsaxonicus]